MNRNLRSLSFITEINKKLKENENYLTDKKKLVMENKIVHSKYSTIFGITVKILKEIHKQIRVNINFYENIKETNEDLINNKYLQDIINILSQFLEKRKIKLRNFLYTGENSDFKYFKKCLSKKIKEVIEKHENDTSNIREKEVNEIINDMNLIYIIDKNSFDPAVLP